MTLTYFNDVNVYFHMKNHYKMLKRVKSVVDTSLPQSLLKSPVAMNSSEKRLKGATNERLRKIYNITKRGGQVRRHSCLNSEAKSEASLKGGSLPSRPATRRNPILTPRESFPPRSSSVGPPIKAENMFKFRQKKRPSISSTRSTNSEIENTNLQLELEENTKSPLQGPPSTKYSPSGKNSNNASPKCSNKTSKSPFLKESSEEQEYLLFLLRITEDIIVNDFYTNSDIKQVFSFHIEANKDRLNVRKMQYHIGNLCKELNIDFVQYPNDDPDEVDDPGKFISSPLQRNIYLNEAFLNCHDCSTIRTSSLYKMHSPAMEKTMHKDNTSIPPMEYDGDNSSISPSLLKLLDKLSLGRVTECTEPVASTSTMNSPTFIPNSISKEHNIDRKSSNSPIDFDTFVRELNSGEDIFESKNNLKIHEEIPQFPQKDVVSLERPSLQIYTTLITENLIEQPDLPESPSILKPPQSFTEPSPVALKSANEETKSESEISENDVKSLSISEKYESEFERNTSSSNSFVRSEESERRDVEKLDYVDETQKETKTISSDIADKSEITVDKTDVEDNQSISDVKSFTLLIVENNEAVMELPNLSTPKEDSNNCPSKVELSLKLELSKNLSNENLAKSVENQQVQNQTDRFEQLTESTLKQDVVVPVHTLTVFHSEPEYKSLEAKQVEPEAHSNVPEKNINDPAKPSEDQDTSKQDSILKVIVQGSLNDDDYVMIKGPVYVYKPLLHSEPKLVVINNEIGQLSRRNSVDSQHSNKTFTIDNDRVREQSTSSKEIGQNIDEGVQIDTSLHSMEFESMDNILALTRRAYSHPTESNNMLNSDYDLTPEKDSDNKYHHLMAEVSTSVSGVNIKESLLLTDGYLTTDDVRELSQQAIFNDFNVEQTPKCVDDYRNFKPEFNVVRSGRNIEFSVSMPQLGMSESRNPTNDCLGQRNHDEIDDEPKEGVENGKKAAELLSMRSSDFMKFDALSQDSSLGSDSESHQRIDKLKNTVPWSSFLNR